MAAGGGTALYDRIGTLYDATRRADPYIVRRLLHHLGRVDGRVLDLGCGSANYTAALSRAGLETVGIDASGTMLQRALGKDARFGLVQSDAAALPFGARSFAGAVSTFAHHHFPDAAAAFAEVLRVLEAGARFAIFTFTSAQMRHYWLAEYFPAMMARAIREYEAMDTEGCLERAGFAIEARELYEIHDGLEDNFLYCGKHRPALYLDSAVRAGISTFRLFAEPREIEAGCARLAADIRSGRIDEVRKAYRDPGGDYVFVIARKRPQKPGRFETP